MRHSICLQITSIFALTSLSVGRADPPQPVVDLGGSPPWISSSAVLINDAGRIIGAGQLDETGDWPTRAFVCEDGDTIPLPTVPKTEGAFRSDHYPIDMNARGQVVGQQLDYGPTGYSFHSVLWDKG